MSDTLRDQLLGLGFKPAPKPERKPDTRRDGRPLTQRMHRLFQTLLNREALRELTPGEDPTMGSRATLIEIIDDLAVSADHQGARAAALAEVLARHPHQVFGRDELLERVFPEASDPGVVDTYVYYLRRKLGDDAANPRYVRTVRGVGYQARSHDPA